MIDRLVAALLVSLLAGVAPAATTATTIAVTTNLQPACRLSARPLAFPAYRPGGGAKNASSVISVHCTRTTAFTVALNAGTTAGSTFAQRLMASAAGTLQYNLYANAARSSIFGDGTASTVTRTGTGAGMATVRNVTVYGRLPDSPANQAAAPGNYADTITVTVSY